MSKRSMIRDVVVNGVAKATVLDATEDDVCACDGNARGGVHQMLPPTFNTTLDELRANTAEYGARDDKDTQTVVYVSGPMRGLPEFNYPAFHDAAHHLRDLGYEVVNPAENFDGTTDLANEVYLREDVKNMAEKCNAIYLLPGWQNSAGARLEYNVAKSLGFEFLPAGLIYLNPAKVADHVEPVELEASRIVRNGERQAVYGPPSQDFNRTSMMWTGYLQDVLKVGAVLTMEDVANMMTMLKISRLKGTPGHRDSIVDAIGYQICNSRLKEDS